MWTSRYFTKRYWTERYWTRNGTAIEVCVYVPGPRNKFGTKRKFGTCLKFGDGYSDPWFPEIGADPLTDPRYTIESGNTVHNEHDDTLLSIDNRDELSVTYDGLPNETFYLQSPNGLIWEVTIDGDTGDITIRGGGSLDPVQGDNLQLAFLDADVLWEPALPLSPGTLDTPDQYQLLWDYPRFGGGESVNGVPQRKVIVSLDGELFDLTVEDTGELRFRDDLQTHTTDTALTPTFTEE